jgi:hypothetical protein
MSKLLGRIFNSAGVLGLFSEEDQFEYLKLVESGQKTEANDMLWKEGCDKIVLSYDKFNIPYDMWVVGSRSYDNYYIYPFTVDPSSEMLSKNSDIIYDPIKVSYWAINKVGGVQTMWVMSAYPVLVNYDIIERANKLFPVQFECDSKMIGHICSMVGC